MDTQKSKNLIENAVAELEAQLRAGKSDSLKRFLAVAARFHDYSFRNQLLIASQRPDATRVAGFQAWKKLGRFVKKGEKGITIIAPIVGKQREDAAPIQDAKEEGKGIFGFRGVHVFDLAQTDGKPLPELTDVTGDPVGNLDALKRFAESRAITLEHSPDLGGPLGASYGGRIVLLQGLAPAEEFSTLAHELAHEILHRDKGTCPKKTVRETEAEAVAFIVCSAAGLDLSTSASDYIQLYDGNAETLMASLERIQRTASTLIASVQEPKAEVAA